MDEIELRLTKEQCSALVKLLYFADYCASNGLISEFNDSIQKENLVKAIEAIYTVSEEKSGGISIYSLAAESPFSDEEILRRQQMIESDLDRIANLIFARRFAMREINLPERESLFEHEGGWIKRMELINERMQPYLREFSENGISNLRFKLLYTLPEDENEQ